MSYETSIAVVCRDSFGVEIGSHKHFKPAARLQNLFTNEAHTVRASQDVNGFNRKSCYTCTLMNEAQNIYKSIQSHNKSSILFTSAKLQLPVKNESLK